MNCIDKLNFRLNSNLLKLKITFFNANNEYKNIDL